MDDYSDAVSSVIGDGQAAQAQAVGSINDNPDQAARAIQLSDATGVPAPVIAGDVDNFETQHKSALAGQLIQNNPQLQTYVGANPMAKSVSNDDYGQLDAVSQATDKLNILSPTKAMIQGFSDGFDYEGQKAESQSLMNYIDSPLWRGAVHAAIGPAFGLLDSTSHVFSGAVQGLAAGIKTDYQYITGADETQSNKLFRDLIVGAQVAMAGEGVNGFGNGLHPEMVKAINEASSAVDKATPYIAAGKDIPVGVHYAIDENKVSQANTDLANLKSAMSEAQDSATKERAPELFRNFVAQHIGEQEVGISADAVRELYGNKVPSADDGLLGFVPDLASQMLRGTATGADIQVPTADLLAKMDPDVFKELEDHIRVRPDGVTKDEGSPPVGEVAPGPNPVADTVRQAAALDPIDGKVPEAEPESNVVQLHSPEEQAQLQLFNKAAAIGMTEKQYGLYMKKIGEQQAADFDAVQKRALAAERKRQTPEWKTAETTTKQDVTREIQGQPRHVVDRLLRDKEMPPIDTDSLTDEQRAGLPKEYYRRGGLDPDYVANTVGFESGDEMVQDLSTLNAERTTTGMNSYGYMNKLIADETARRMEVTHGNLSENILAAAKEQVLSQTQLDILHAETEGLAQKAGAEFPLSKEQVRAGVRASIDDAPIGQLNSDKFLAAAGRAGRATEDALLKGDAAEAFRQKQRQYSAIAHAQEVMKLEKQQAAFKKLAKQYSKAEVTGALPEYTNQIHDMLVRLGQPVQASIQFIHESMDKDGYKTLDDFVKAKEADGRALHVPDFLRDPNFNTSLDKLTADQFSQVADAMKAMAYNSRDESKIIRAGAKADFNETRNAMIEQMKDLGTKHYDINTGKYSPKNIIRNIGWSLIQVESMFNRLDKGDPEGIFNQTIVRSYSEAANYRERVLKEYNDRLKALPRIENPNKIVPHDLFIDPIDGTKLVLRRNNLMGILQHLGNDSNARKLAEGYNLNVADVKTWVEQNTTKEDWDRAQKIGDHFADLHELADNMSRNISGVGIRKLKLQPVPTKFGTYDGWYNPVKYDTLRKSTTNQIGRGVLDQDGAYRATTPQGYTKDRNAYVAPVQLNLDAVASTMKQIIHDATMRSSIVQLSKFFYDPKFMQAIKNHYSEAVADSMIPFLRDMANTPDYISPSETSLNRAVDHMMQNMTASLIGMNPGTVLKHGPTALVNSVAGVGPLNFAREFTTLMKTDTETGKSNWRTAMDESDELARRTHNFTDLVKGTGQDISLAKSGGKNLYLDARTLAMHFGSSPVAAADLLSAVPTYLAARNAALASGADLGQAKFEGDRAVRQAHGSSISTNRPAIMRQSNALAKTFGTLYGFFNEMLQKQYEIMWRTKDAISSVSDGEIRQGAAQVPKIAGLILTRVIAPALIENMVQSYIDKKDSWPVAAGKVAIHGVGASIWGVRDLVSSIMEGYDPNPSQVGTIMKTAGEPFKDLMSGKAFTPAKAGDFMKHAIAFTGLATGLTNAEEGKSAEFIWNYFHGREHPQNTWQFATGLKYGKTAGHARSFDDWVKHAGTK